VVILPPQNNVLAGYGGLNMGNYKQDSEFLKGSVVEIH